MKRAIPGYELHALWERIGCPQAMIVVYVSESGKGGFYTNGFYKDAPANAPARTLAEHVMKYMRGVLGLKDPS